MKGQKTEERQRRLIGERLSEPALARISLDHHFANINDKASTKPYKFLCDTKEFSVVSEIYHIFSLSLLHYPTIYDRWIVSVMVIAHTYACCYLLFDKNRFTNNCFMQERQSTISYVNTKNNNKIDFSYNKPKGQRPKVVGIYTYIYQANPKCPFYK